MSVETILNYIQISESMASSGQPEERQFGVIASDGYAAIVNLAMPNSDRAIPEEGNIVTSYGMSYFHIPVPYNAPNVEHLRQFINIMNALSNQKVWVHCAMNYRVSAFLYQYQKLVFGASEGEAKKVVLPSWSPNRVWKEFMALGEEEVAL
ncbi:protein tyrosine phosphatase family protein [Beggiatoa alba]|nr:protein tyrosine phosphatase family protein [Beggiatoa alba]